MYTIRKSFRFEAAHKLEGLADGHPCMRPHGHSYRVELVLRSQTLNEHSFLRDYNDLKPLQDFIDANLDHRDLNIELGIATTAENLAKFFYDWSKKLWPEVCMASVSETQKTWASYSE